MTDIFLGFRLIYNAIWISRLEADFQIMEDGFLTDIKSITDGFLGYKLIFRSFVV